MRGNQTEPFILTYRYIHTETHTYMHTQTHIFSYAIYVTDMQQTYITDIIMNGKDILRMNLSENGDEGKKVKAKEVEAWSWIFFFASVHASSLSYAFMEKINLLY